MPSTAIVLAPPDDVVHAQNAERPGRTVPPDVVDRHLRSLRELLASGRLDAEGFAAIYRLEGTVRLERITIVRRPGVHRGAGSRPRVDV